MVAVIILCLKLIFFVRVGLCVCLGIDVFNVEFLKFTPYKLKTASNFVHYLFSYFSYGRKGPDQ